MFKTITAVFAAIALLFGAAVVWPTKAQEKGRPYTDIRTVVRPILAGEEGRFGNGSGVMIAPGRMLTAHHVAVQAEVFGDQFTVEGKPVKVLREDEQIDIALLEVQASCPCATLVEALAVIDEPVALVGYPKSRSVHVQVVTRGEVQGYYEHRMVVTAPGALGVSGGGVFVKQDGRWLLAGIVVELSSQCSMPNICSPIAHLTHAVDAKTIRTFLGTAL